MAEDTANSDSNGVDDYDSDGVDWVPTDVYYMCSPDDCDFTVTSGEYKGGVATWHPADPGFSLVGDLAEMSVTDEYAAHPESPIECYTIYVQGEWDVSVEVEVRVTGEYGVFGISPNEDSSDAALYDLPEGEFELSRKVKRAPWEPWTMNVLTLNERGQMTFSIVKTGKGNANFYYIDISGDEDCVGDAVILDE